MLVEGKGIIAPTPVRVGINRTDLEWLEGIARDREARRNYAGRSDTWGKGIVANPTLVGLVGEYCLAQYLASKLGIKVEINLNDTPRGDGGVDLVVLRRRVQVKTRGRRGVILIRRESESDKLVPIEWDVAVSATWDASGNRSCCELDGYINRQDFLELSEFKQSRRGNWNNLEARDEDLDSMPHMVDKFKLLLPEKGGA